MPQENEANLVDPSEEPGDDVVDPSEEGGAAHAAYPPQQDDQGIGEPSDEGDGPNR